MYLLYFSGAQRRKLPVIGPLNSILTTYPISKKVLKIKFSFYLIKKLRETARIAKSVLYNLQLYPLIVNILSYLSRK